MNPWNRTLSAIKYRCNNKNGEFYKYYGGKGIKNFLTAEDLKFLWFRDKAYQMKRPSIQRNNSNGHYELKNCCYMELSQNSNFERRNSPNCPKGHRYPNNVRRVNNCRVCPICFKKAQKNYRSAESYKEKDRKLAKRLYWKKKTTKYPRKP